MHITQETRPFVAPGLHVSHSQVATYLICPERYRLQYVRGLTPSHRAGEMVFGSVIHRTLAFFHQSVKDFREPPPLESLLGCFKELLELEQRGRIPILWADEDAPQNMEERGRELLRLYSEQPQPEVLGVEQRFEVEPHQLPKGFALDQPLVGVIDVVERDPDGALWITEVKTAGRKFDATRLRYDLQLGIYAAVRNAIGLHDAKMRFRVLVKTKQPRIETYDVARDTPQVAETGRVVTQVLRAIDKSIFYPNRGWACGTCPFRSACGE